MFKVNDFRIISPNAFLITYTPYFVAKRNKTV